MRILIYEALPDINRAPFLARLARALQAQGHQVLLALEERLIYTLCGALTPKGVIDCRGLICGFIAGDKSLSYTVLPVERTFYDGVSPDNLVSKLAELSIRRAAFYEALLERVRPDLVMLWNGHADHQQDFVAAQYAAGCVHTLYMECGWFPQRRFFYWDPQGVNAASSIARKRPSALTDAQARQIGHWRADYTDPYRAVAEKKWQIFVPLQVDTDSNVLGYSPFANMAEFIRHLEEVVPPDYNVVLRPHPLGHYDYPIRCERDNFEVDNDTPLYDLIAASEYVVGINSTVLLEALVFGKPVVAFGRGIFDASNAVARGRQEEPLPLAWRPDQKAVDALLYELVFRVQIPLSCVTLPALPLLASRAGYTVADAARGSVGGLARYPLGEVYWCRLKYSLVKCAGMLR